MLRESAQDQTKNRLVDMLSDPILAARAKVPAPSLRRILIVDLNNFATFPTLAIGLLVAALRRDGHEVDVLCPLAHGVVGISRERADTLVDHVKRRVHLSTAPMFQFARDAARNVRRLYHERPQPTVLREVTRAMGRRSTGCRSRR